MGWPHGGRAARTCEGPREWVSSSKGRPVGLMRQCLPGGSYTCSPHITFQTPAGGRASLPETLSQAALLHRHTPRRSPPVFLCTPAPR